MPGRHLWAPGPCWLAREPGGSEPPWPRVALCFFLSDRRLTRKSVRMWGRGTGPSAPWAATRRLPERLCWPNCGPGTGGRADSGEQELGAESDCWARLHSWWGWLMGWIWICLPTDDALLRVSASGGHLVARLGGPSSHPGQQLRPVWPGGPWGQTPRFTGSLLREAPPGSKQAGLPKSQHALFLLCEGRRIQRRRRRRK